MCKINTKIYFLIAFCFLIFLVISPSTYADTQERTITISETQEWGQIIVESNIEAFEVDIITPDGSKWINSEKQDEDTLFYFKDTNFRHWAAEKLISGTYKVLINGPSTATYTVTNQNSYSQIKVSLNSPKADQTYTITADSPALKAEWSYTGDILRSNEIQYWLQPLEGGEHFLLSSSYISFKQSELTFSNNIVDGKYKLYYSYDDNTSTLTEIDSNIIVEINRGKASESIEFGKLEAAGHGAYGEFNLPQLYNIDTVEVALIGEQAQAPYEWLTYSMKQLEKVNVPDGEEYTDAYRNRYGIYIPTEQAGTFRVAIRIRLDSGIPSSIFTSEQKVTLEPKTWSEDLIAWSVEDGLTNANYAELKVKTGEAARIMIMLNNETIIDEQLDSAKKQISYQLPLSEGEQAYVVYAYDELGNYMTDGRLLIVDHTSPRLELIAPLASHSTLAQKLVSGWTEKDVTLTINDDQVTVDEYGYFSYKTKAKTIDIVVKEASGNETVYHWEATAGTAIAWWLIIIVVVIVGAVIYIMYKKRKVAPEGQTEQQ